MSTPTHPRRRPRVSAVLCPALLIALLAPCVPAQTPDASPAASTQPSETALAFTADSIKRVALMDLRLQAAPTGDDYAIAGALLGLAQTLDPNNPELARRRVEAAYRAGDEDALWQATRTVVRLDPRDTVAVLRLISMTITRLQTAEDRLAAYDRYLGPGGAALDPSIRSRLALDAALLAREQGDEAGFVTRLTQATALDATNKDAAALAATYFAQQVADDPVGQTELIINLLIADPLDPQVHLTLARQLAGHGVFDQADRFHAIARHLHLLDLGGLPGSLETQRLVLKWERLGPEAPIAELNEMLVKERYEAQTLISQLQADDKPTSSIRKPEDIRLTAQSERVRILAAHTVKDEALLAAAFADFSASLNELQARLSNPSSLPPTTSIESVRELVRSMAIDQVVLHLWTGYDAQSLIAQLQGSSMLDPNGPARDAHLDLWVALYSTEPASALAGFETLQGTDPLASIGAGLARERLEDPGGAVASYRSVTDEFPLTPAAAWARSRIAALTGQPVPPDPAAARLTALANQVPVLVDKMAHNPLAFMQLDAKLVANELKATDPVLVTISLQNTSSLPQGLGPDRAISTRLMIAPTLDVGVENRNRFALPEIVELDRRLRLMPRETVRATIAIDAGFTGWYAQTESSTSQRLRARVIQGFRLSGGATFPGPLCLTKDIEQVRRLPNPASSLTTQQLADRLADAPTAELAELLLAARSRMIDPAVSSSDRSALIPALIGRYTDATPLERMMMLTTLPTARVAPELAGFDTAAASLGSRETDRGVLLALLVTRASSIDDPIFASPALGEHPDLLELALAIRVRLASGATTYATAGPSIESFAGISQLPDESP